jgi:hypothetical protein
VDVILGELLDELRVRMSLRQQAYIICQTIRTSNTFHIRVFLGSCPNDPGWSLLSSAEDCTFALDYGVETSSCPGLTACEGYKPT